MFKHDASGSSWWFFFIFDDLSEIHNHQKSLDNDSESWLIMMHQVQFEWLAQVYIIIIIDDFSWLTFDHEKTSKNLKNIWCFLMGAI